MCENLSKRISVWSLIRRLISVAFWAVVGNPQASEPPYVAGGFILTNVQIFIRCCSQKQYLAIQHAVFGWTWHWINISWSSLQVICMNIRANNDGHDIWRILDTSLVIISRIKPNILYPTYSDALLVWCKFYSVLITKDYSHLYVCNSCTLLY